MCFLVSYDNMSGSDLNFDALISSGNNSSADDSDESMTVFDALLSDANDSSDDSSDSDHDAATASVSKAKPKFGRKRLLERFPHFSHT